MAPFDPVEAKRDIARDEEMARIVKAMLELCLQHRTPFKAMLSNISEACVEKQSMFEAILKLMRR